MSDVALPPSLVDSSRNHLETAPTLVDFVRQVNLENYLELRVTNTFSWKGFYEYLSTEKRAFRLGFGATKFGKYNTAPTRQILTYA